MIHWQQVLGSSNVDAIAYDAEKQECYVRFLSGAVYVYEKVGPGIWEELKHASSKGRFIGIHLRRAHSYRRLTEYETSSSGGSVGGPGEENPGGVRS